MNEVKLLQRRYLTIAAIIAALFVIAIAGYMIPVEKQDVPARIVMDNTGGRVIFSHQAHAEDYGFDCIDCHHDDIGSDTFLACGTCHPAEFNDDFRVNHQKAFPSDEACLRCHDDVPTAPLAEDERPDIENIPLRAEAFHTQCMGCHEENGGPYGDDSCYQCHAR
ncbi:Pentaheme cytochrome c [Pseudodesulfovibrio piezophilus C1TLV30]|uniref:Pentaheme cytochrome c n=1 Tax=Pseudodesulfovibrio piezophilus (strain DSM 21447 / JCM 15486 / C1TLV30) TaxID=1322246 RepID=M1WND4_PSEP2|nr:Pentaheme cytochrome c [Pseudodesulfovibrio piezophilus C1TLV30]